MRIVKAVLFLLLLSSPQQLGAEPVHWGVDVDLLIEAVEQVHPNPWHRTTRSEFMKRAQRLRTEITAMTDPEATIALASLVASLEDGHTRLDVREIIRYDRTYPVLLRRFPDGVGIVAVSDERHRHLLGARVVSILGEPVIRVWDRVEAVVPGDNIHSRMANAPLHLVSPALMHALGYESTDPLEIVIESDGERTEVSLAAEESGDDPWFVRPSLSIFSSADNGDLSFRNSSSPYTTIVDEERALVYARIDQVLDSERPAILAGEARPRAVTLDGFYDHLFELIDEGASSKLVIDLRENEGGNNNKARRLVREISARPAINRKGALFVLTDGTTFSAAMNLVSMLESETEAIFVGEAPGGSPLHAGDARAITLPSSGLQLFVSTLHWDLGVSPWDVRDVMTPDIPAPMTLEAANRGIDPALDAVRNYGESSILADRLLLTYERESFEEAVALATEEAENADPRWRPVTEHLIDFGWGLIYAGASGSEIYTAFEKATELFPDDFTTWFTLGRIYMWPGRWEDAARAFSMAESLRPANRTISRMAALARLRAQEQARP